MADPSTLPRVIDELLWALRRAGVACSPAQAADALRAVRAVGLESEANVATALRCVLVSRAADRTRFDAAFAAYFASARGDARKTVWDRLALLGFAPAELELLRGLLARCEVDLSTLSAALHAGADWDERVGRALSAMSLDDESGTKLGYRTHLVLRMAGLERARAELVGLRDALALALGARGGLLCDALGAELDRADADVRANVRQLFLDQVTAAEERRRSRTAMVAPLDSLGDEDLRSVRRALGVLAERIRASSRLRARRKKRGRLDARSLVRESLRTCGVPVRLPRQKRARVRPKLVVLCDVSDSVRPVARLLLEVTQGLHELFEDSRTFVFVSEILETTARSPREAHARKSKALQAGFPGVGDNSNYGRMLRAFEVAVSASLDRRTTVVVLGDGRTNFHDPAAEVLGRIRARARGILWLCPEPRSRWGDGDSAMLAYAPLCFAALPVRNGVDLERGIRRLYGASVGG